MLEAIQCPDAWQLRVQNTGSQNPGKNEATASLPAHTQTKCPPTEATAKTVEFEELCVHPGL